MKAYKCDRCGSLIESEERKEIFNKYPSIYVTVQDVSQLVDLCEQCSLGLKNWLTSTKSVAPEECLKYVGDPYEEGGL